MRQTAQLFYRPDGYHGPSKTLGCSHSAEGGLHRRTITLYHTSGVLFCRYCVLCISFEMAYIITSANPGVDITLLFKMYDLAVGFCTMPINKNRPKTV